MKGGGRFKLVHSKGRISKRGGGGGKKGGRNGNENTRHKFDARDGVSRQNFSVSKILWWLVLGSVCYRWAERSRCDVFQVKYRNNHWKHTFSYKLNIFLVIESKDLICIYYTDLIKIFMIRWREIVKYYAELEGNQKLNTKKWRTRFDSGRVSNTLWRFLKFPSFDVNILKSSLLIYHRIHRQISLSFESIANFSWGLEIIRDNWIRIHARFHAKLQRPD